MEKKDWNKQLRENHMQNTQRTIVCIADWKLSFKSRRVGESLRLQSRQLWLKGFSFFHASIKKRRIHTFINLKCPTGQVLVQHEEIRIEVMKLLSHLSILSSQQHIAAVHQIFERVPRASIEQIKTVMDCLNTFCVSSGQRVSVAKIRISFSKNVPRSLSNAISLESGFSLTHDLGKYLGVPLLHNRVRLQGKLIITFWRR